MPHSLRLSIIACVYKWLTLSDNAIKNVEQIDNRFKIDTWLAGIKNLK